MSETSETKETAESVFQVIQQRWLGAKLARTGEPLTREMVAESAAAAFEAIAHRIEFDSDVPPAGGVLSEAQRDMLAFFASELEIEALEEIDDIADVSEWDETEETKAARIAAQANVEIAKGIKALLSRSRQAESGEVVGVRREDLERWSAAMRETLAAVDEAYTATGYSRVAKTSEQRSVITTAIAEAEAALADDQKKGAR